MNTDKAGKSYWEHNWRHYEAPEAIDPANKNLSNYVNLRFHELFREVLATENKRAVKLLEIGCARSSWLPYFVQEFGFEASGIDYSEAGCRQAEQVLLNEGVEGEIFHADFFSPPSRMLDAFDAAISFGVAEHFESPTECIHAFSRFLKPGGIIVTIIPNLTGILGTLQKVINRPAFNVHVPINRDALRQAHEEAGLTVSFCDYFLFGGFTIINLENLRSTPAYNTAVRLRSLLSKVAWRAEGRASWLEPNRWTSPYVVCIATKPCA